MLGYLSDLQDVSTPQYIIRTGEAEKSSSGKERLNAGQANNKNIYYIYYNKFVLRVIAHVSLAS